MKNWTYGKVVLGAVGLLILIFDGRTAIAGMEDGLQICIRSLIPSLFPFFVISGLLTGDLVGIRFRPLRFLHRLCRIPDGCENLLISGLLAGYPVGAGNIYTAKSKGLLCDKEAQRMAVFCNNPGPAFIFGVLGQMFDNLRWTLALWTVLILSAILTGMLLPGTRNLAQCSSSAQFIKPASSMSGAVKSMALVCGWVTFFTMVLTFLDKWLLCRISPTCALVIRGMLELSSGCLELSQIADPAIRFLLSCFLLSFGGLCILLQTKAVYPDLDLKRYCLGKLLQTLIAMLLALAAAALLGQVSYRVFLIFCAGGLFSAVSFSPLRKKEVAIPKSL